MILVKLIKLWRSRRITKHNVIKVMKTFEEFGFDAMLFVSHPDYPEARISIVASGENPDNCFLPTRRLLKDLKKELKAVGVDFEYTIKQSEGRRKK